VQTAVLMFPFGQFSNCSSFPYIARATAGEIKIYLGPFCMKSVNIDHFFSGILSRKYWYQELISRRWFCVSRTGNYHLLSCGIAGNKGGSTGPLRPGTDSASRYQKTDLEPNQLTARWLRLQCHTVLS